MSAESSGETSGETTDGAAREATDGGGRRVGVGPHPQPWPVGDHFDTELLRHGDRRNVIDRYRYWSVAAIKAHLQRRRHTFHVAIENWEHDLNIGTVVRTANAFCAAGVHIVGMRRWNRRGAMMTDKYLTVHHHPSVRHLIEWAAGNDLAVVAVDNVPGALSLEQTELPENCVLLFGQEGPGLTPEAMSGAELVVGITQYGSTRSLNASVAAGITMHAWIRRWVTPPRSRVSISDVDHGPGRQRRS